MGSSKSSWARAVEQTRVTLKISPWWRQVLAIARKEFQSEWRTRHALVTTFAFALIALTVVSLSVGSLRSEPALAAGLFWVILFFAAIVALGRTVTKEVDAHTENLLRLNADATAVFAGKMLFNFALLTFVAAFTAPLFMTAMGVDVANLGLFSLTIFLTLVTMAALGTLLGAMLARAQSRIALLGVAAFPLFFPALAAALQTSAALFSGDLDTTAMPLRALTAYAGVALLGGLLLFDEVW
ncbi:MAG: hypothetical protein IMHGJWDQ_001292 [Candidatus Fervidibacter sp.]